MLTDGGLVRLEGRENADEHHAGAASPYSPEPNPIENLWHYLKSHYLSNRAYTDYDELVKVGGDAWRALTPEVIRSVCQSGYLTHEEAS